MPFKVNLLSRFFHGRRPKKAAKAGCCVKNQLVLSLLRSNFELDAFNSIARYSRDNFLAKNVYYLSSYGIAH